MIAMVYVLVMVVDLGASFNFKHERVAAVFATQESCESTAVMWRRELKDYMKLECRVELVR